MRCVSSEGVDLSQLPHSPPAPHLDHCSEPPDDRIVAMGTVVDDSHNHLNPDSNKVIRPTVGKTTEGVFTADLNSASSECTDAAEADSTYEEISTVTCFNPNRTLLSQSSASMRIDDCTAANEREPSSYRSSSAGLVRESVSEERQSASTLSSSSSLIDSRPNNEKHPSTFSFSSSLKTISLSKEDTNEACVLKDDASVLFRSSNSSLTVLQSSESKTHTSAFSSASSLCTRRSESESRVPNGSDTSSAVRVADTEMLPNTNALCDVANTSRDRDDTLTASRDEGKVSDHVEHVYENTMFCESSPAVHDHDRTLTKESDEEEKEKATLYQNVSDTASTESSGTDTPTSSQPRASSHERSPLPTFSFDFEPQLEEALSKGLEPKPTLPERYRHALRRNGSYGNLGGCHNGSGSGGQGSDQDLTSREKDLGSALAWIRHEIMEMKEQDKLLLKRFIELRASILQLRCMYDVMGSTSDLSSMDGSCVSLNEVRKSPRMHSLVRTESDAMMSGAMFKATSSLSLPCSPQLSRLRWTSNDLI